MIKYTSLNDHQLVLQLKARDEKAYKEIYDRFWAVLYRHASRMLSDEEEAEDVVQEVFLNLWSKAHTLELKTSLSNYLYTVVRNRIFDHFDHSKVKEKYMTSLQKFIEHGNCETDFLIREKQLFELIQQEVDSLPERMREIFKLSRNSGMAYQEIAQHLNITESVVRNQISRALTILRTKFGLLAIIYFYFK